MKRQAFWLLMGTSLLMTQMRERYLSEIRTRPADQVMKEMLTTTLLGAFLTAGIVSLACLFLWARDQSRLDSVRKQRKAAADHQMREPRRPLIAAENDISATRFDDLV
jgi:hypothetical protein